MSITQQQAAAGNISPIEPKIARVLRAFLTRPTLNRFQAERDPAIADHVLPSTVSELKRAGVRIASRLVKAHGYAGAPVWLAEYSLPLEAHAQAKRVLECILDRAKPRHRE